MKSMDIVDCEYFNLFLFYNSTIFLFMNLFLSSILLYIAIFHIDGINLNSKIK